MIIASSEKLRYPYTRPEFLYFSAEEITLSADQTTRPVLCPKDPSRMPVYAGYAEVINAGIYIFIIINLLKALQMIPL